MTNASGLSIDANEERFTIRVTLPIAFSKANQAIYLRFLDIKFGPDLNDYRFSGNKVVIFVTKRNPFSFKVIEDYVNAIEI